MSIEKHAGGYRVGYTRVSTLEQDDALQREALTASGCQRIFTDKASGKLERRPALDTMLDQLRSGDTVVVYRLDRLGRTLRHLIDTVNDLESRGIAFVSLTESIDTSSPGGKLEFHVFGALAEFERDLIKGTDNGWIGSSSGKRTHWWQADGLDTGEAGGGQVHVLTWGTRCRHHRQGHGGFEGIGLPGSGCRAAESNSEGLLMIS